MDTIPNHGAVVGAPEDLLIGQWGTTVPPAGTSWRLIALGDVGLSGIPAVRAARAGHARSLLGDLRPTLQAADLADAGLDVVQLANNHILDYGPAGMTQTLRTVESAGLTVIGGGCEIYDTDFHQLNADDRLANRGPVSSAPVRIGPKTFVGGYSIILKGVSIGTGAIIGAGSVVTRDVPDFEVWAGIPAKFVRKLRPAEMCEDSTEKGV